MKPRSFVILLAALVVLTTASQLQAQRIKVIVDQDARGPATTDMQSILIFLQSDKFDVLGITTVSAFSKLPGGLTFRSFRAPSSRC